MKILVTLFVLYALIWGPSHMRDFRSPRVKEVHLEKPPIDPATAKAAMETMRKMQCPTQPSLLRTSPFDNEMPKGSGRNSAYGRVAPKLGNEN